MVVRNRSGRLRKELGLLDVYAVALGTTLSAGFFLLPGLAVAEAGPAVVLAYLVAAIPLVPAMFAIVELATAMPRAGGSYYFLDRSLGPLVGTIGGFGTWLALILKTAFALEGMGAYLALLVPSLPVVTVAAAIALGLAAVNVRGTRETGRLQLLFVLGIVAILLLFIAAALPQTHLGHFDGALDQGAESVLATAGLVYVSYVGITNIASLSEEVHDPEHVLPRGIFSALATAVTIYVLGTTAMVGLVPPADLAGDLTPAGTAAGVALGEIGRFIIAIAALFASASVASAGILSASRYPLAMSRDHLLPTWLSTLGRHETPVRGIAVSVGAVLVALFALDPAHIAKYAGAFQLLMFSLLNLAVIVMRESQIESYDPGYRSPLYPWMQLFGLLAPLVLIGSLGAGTSLFAVGLIGISVLWYWGYARDRVVRAGAVYHVFERLGRQRYADLDTELRGILKEKGLREDDPFDEVVARGGAFDLEPGAAFEQAVDRASRHLSSVLGCSGQTLARGFLQGTRVGSTPVERGIAIPHLRLPDIPATEIVLARSRSGIAIQAGSMFGAGERVETSHAIFFVVSPDGDAPRHLRFMAQIAARVEDEGFLQDWAHAPDTTALKEMLLRSERSVSIVLMHGQPAAAWIDRAVRDIDVPEGCLIVMIRRAEEFIVPRGNTLLREGDSLTVIGNPKEVAALRQRFAHPSL